MSTSPRPAGILAVVVAVIAALAVSSSQRALAQGATSLKFERPAAQGAGTPGYQVVSDPTIRPFMGPGKPATIGVTVEIDFQGNGRPDLVACYGSHPEYPRASFPCRIVRPQADGSLKDITHQMFGTAALPLQEGAYRMAVGDFNGDGRVDVFIGAWGHDYTPFAGATNVLLVSNADGTYTDRSSTLPQAPDLTASTATADIDGDGKLDIYVGNNAVNLPGDTRNGGSNVGPYFLIGRGDGTFTQKTTGLPPTMRENRDLYSSSALIDVNQDGHTDLVLGAGSPLSQDSIVLFNDGAGDFTKKPPYMLPLHPFAPERFSVESIAVVDANRDGLPDLLLTATRVYVGNGLQVLINRGDGTFADETATRLGPSAVTPSGNYCGTLRLADFNGDGWQDIYCSDGQQDFANRYWLSNGDGTWTPLALGVLSGGSGFGIHAVDFDGDGRSDLVQLFNTNLADMGYNSFLNRTPPPSPAVITMQPVNRTVPAGHAVSFFVKADGNPAPSYQWQISTNTGASWTNLANTGSITGVATSSLTVTGVTAAADGTLYRCVVSNNSGGSTPSSGAKLTVMTSGAGSFDADTRADLAIFRPASGQWFVRQSHSSYSYDDVLGFQWGLNGDTPIPGDFDGDGRNNLVIFRPSTGTWYLRYSATDYSHATSKSFPWGLPGDLPLAGDFDADGKYNLVVYRPSTGMWHVRFSASSYETSTSYQWGLLSDMPLAADFDGDGRTDLAVWRPSSGVWFIRDSSSDYATWREYQWGLAGDVPLVADFDGDAKADVAVYRPTSGMWYVRFSTLLYSYATSMASQWGQPGDVPISSDFDGDGRTDLAVWRPSSGTWFIRYSSTDYNYAASAWFQWGVHGDVPLSAR